MTARVFAVVALSVLASACQERRLSFVAGGDGSLGPPQGRDGGLLELPDAEPPPDTLADGGVDAADGSDACVPLLETCNGRDDNCDGVIDDGFDFNTDPTNCGRCGNACTYGNATAACSIGKCRLETCAAGFVDVDRLDVNGCECQTTNGGVEICDGRDQNCNGVVDEGFDLETSVQDCGTCGHVCQFEHATPICARGTCQRGACQAGWVDLDGSARNGCEYACTPANGGVEICDQKDNDCDGEVDESDARVGTRCFPEGSTGCDVATGACGGTCGFGTWACLPGGLVCQNATLPEQDVCDGIDNDCDSLVDEDFDLQNDARWCGACNRVCALANAINGCVAGGCVIKSCRAGWVDLDASTANGCEYACTADGPEVCDGKDNDCDGRLDADDPDLLHPAMNFCVQVGECGKGPGGSPRYPQPTFPVCTKPTGATRPDWVCNYPDSVQLFAVNQVLGQESWCDGLDNDCDGAADEHVVPALGTACTDSGFGECKKTGVLRCAGDRTLAPTCDTSQAGTYTPADEICDGKDNDCDGLADESWDTPPGLGLPGCAGGACRGVRDDVVHVTFGGRSYYIYKHEASRVDATAAAEGTKSTRACSQGSTGAGVLPWTQVNHAQAGAACAAAGMRLCRTTRTGGCGSGAISEDEWGVACQAGATCGGAAQPYPYGCTYDGAACNGLDRGTGAPVPTGSRAMCLGPDVDVTLPGVEAVHELSGNLAEWTEDCRGTLSDGSGRKLFTLRGGSFNNVAQALRCDFMSLVVAETFAFNDTGFRCCSSCPPGQADCGGTCASLGGDPANCGACGVSCAAGQTCGNGTCR